MRKVIRKKEICPTCKKTIHTQKEEVYCDICGQRIIDEVGPLDITVSTYEELGSKYDALDNPDICGFDCLVEYLEGVTQFQGFGLSLYSDEQISALAERLKRKG